MTYTMGVTKRPDERACNTPPGLTGLPDCGKERLVPHSLTPPFSASKSDIDDDILLYRETYRRMLYEHRRSIGSGEIFLALGWSGARFAEVESLAKRSDIDAEFWANTWPNRRKRSAIPRDTKAAVWDKSGGCCGYCGKQLNPFRDFTVDHITPIVMGGSDDISNLVAACRSCNSKKGAN